MSARRVKTRRNRRRMAAVRVAVRRLWSSWTFGHSALPPEPFVITDLAPLFAQMRRQEVDEEERVTREIGEHLRVSPTLIDEVIDQTRRSTAGTPTDWAIARAHLTLIAEAMGVRP